MSNKYCAEQVTAPKHKLSVIEKITGECKWCKQYFCQQHLAVERHGCTSYDRLNDILSQFSPKPVKSHEYINGANCA
jgi:predicted nucleic acid binding AN1-type Zn finger protein